MVTDFKEIRIKTINYRDGLNIGQPMVTNLKVYLPMDNTMDLDVIFNLNYLKQALNGTTESNTLEIFKMAKQMVWAGDNVQTIFKILKLLLFLTILFK